MILVTGGWHESEWLGRSVELLDTNGTRLCSLPNLPYWRFSHSQTSLTCCGGDTYTLYDTVTSCITFNNGSWEKSHILTQEGRKDHSAWASPQGIMLLGGYYSRKTTEILLESRETCPGFALDYKT